MGKQQELTDKYLERAQDLLEDTIQSEEQIQAVIDLVADAIAEAMQAGADAAKFPFQVAEQRGKVKIEGIHGETPQDGINTHYYWAMAAGFAERADADAFLKECRENNPGTQYGLFVNGLPVDYD